jgi:dihydroxy-acid dehydratase
MWTSRQSFAVTQADEMRRRLAATKAPPPRYATGALAKYSKLVSSASVGAVTSE